MHDFSFIDNYDELDLAMLQEDIDELATRQRNLIHIPQLAVKVGDSLVETSGLVMLDSTNQTLSVGYADTQRVNYQVVTDHRPAEVVLDFVKGYFNNGLRSFPHVPVGVPLVPPSRYPKAVEFYEVFEYWLSRGFRIYNPTHAQRDRYTGSCDDVVQSGCKYIVNTKRDFYVKHIKAVMLDFNPFYPDSASHLVKVVVGDKRVDYERIWKDTIVKGNFDYAAKRYHFDVWHQVVMSPRKKHEWVYIQNYDLIVTEYSLFEGCLNMKDGVFSGYVEQVLFSDNIFIEPYDVPLNKVHKIRSNLPYASFPGFMYVPWSSRPISSKREGDTYTHISNRFFKFSGKKYDLANLHTKVKDMKVIVNSGKAQVDKDLLYLGDNIFVKHRWCSIYNGEKVRRDAYTKPEFDGAFILDPKGMFKFIKIPYKISRYPNNGSFTLVPKLEIFPLEEFVSAWRQEFFKSLSFPPWLVKEKDINVREKDNVGEREMVSVDTTVVSPTSDVNSVDYSV